MLYLRDLLFKLCNDCAMNLSHRKAESPREKTLYRLVQYDDSFAEPSLVEEQVTHLTLPHSCVWAALMQCFRYVSVTVRFFLFTATSCDFLSLWGQQASLLVNRTQLVMSISWVYQLIKNVIIIIIWAHYYGNVLKLYRKYSSRQRQQENVEQFKADVVCLR